jgi:HAD superfamily hydrolase (TIGR01490 family)
MGKKGKKKRKLAVFDIDGTIFRSSLLIELVNGLVEDGVFPRKAKKEMEADYLAWLNRIGHYNSYIMQVVNIHQKYIKGCAHKEVHETAKRVVDWHKDRVYRYTRDLAKQLRREGYYLVVISGSPDYIVSMFAKHMHFDATFGWGLEVKKGIFTGKHLNRDSVNSKEKVLRDFISSAKFGIDLRRSIAIGDSESDIPMLESVGRPIAFNPSDTLAEYAKKKGWKIVVERKNVVYEISDCNLWGAV